MPYEIKGYGDGERPVYTGQAYAPTGLGAIERVGMGKR